MTELTPEQWREWLLRRHTAEKPELEELNALYEGEQERAYMHPELLKELGEQMQQVVLNWPRLVADSLEERLDPEGFRYPGQDAGDDELWRIWTANGMVEASQQGRIDALVMRRAFICAGTNEKDASTPLITVESPLQMHADWDPRRRAVRAVVRRWNELDRLTGGVRDQFSSLYLPDSTHHYRFKGGTGWHEYDRDDHKLGVVPVVPVANRPRVLIPGGISELADIVPISNAACKIATDMMVSAEFHAMPRRWALGFDDEDFTDQDGKPLSIWSRIAGRIWATSRTRKDDGAEVGQFPEAQLTNFHSTLEQLSRMVASMGALPPNYMGLAADDAASADAIRSRETRLVKRAERRIGAYSGAYKQLQRLVLRIRDGDWDPDADRLEVLWRNPATPTFAQKADAIVKLVQAGILPVEQAREDLGYTDGQRRRMREMDQDALDRVVLDPAAEFGPKPQPEPVGVPGAGE